MRKTQALPVFTFNSRRYWHSDRLLGFFRERSQLWYLTWITYTVSAAYQEQTVCGIRSVICLWLSETWQTNRLESKWNSAPVWQPEILRAERSESPQTHTCRSGPAAPAPCTHKSEAVGLKLKFQLPVLKPTDTWGEVAQSRRRWPVRRDLKLPCPCIHPALFKGPGVTFFLTTLLRLLGEERLLGLCKDGKKPRAHASSLNFRADTNHHQHVETAMEPKIQVEATLADPDRWIAGVYLRNYSIRNK